MVYSRTVITAVLAAGAISSVLAVPLPGGGSAAPPTNSQSLSSGNPQSLSGSPTAGTVSQPAALSRRADGDDASAAPPGSAAPAEAAVPANPDHQKKDHPAGHGHPESHPEGHGRKKHGDETPAQRDARKAAKKAKEEKMLAAMSEPDRAAYLKAKAEKKAKKHAEKGKHPEHEDKSVVSGVPSGDAATTDSAAVTAPVEGAGKVRRRSLEEHEPPHHLDFFVFEKAVERVDHAKERLRAAEEHLYELFHLEDEGEDVSPHSLDKAKKRVHQAKHRLRAAKKHLKHIEHKFREKFGLEHHEAHHPSDLLRLGKALALASMGHSHPAPPPGLKSFGHPEEVGSVEVEIIAARGATVPPPPPAPQNAPPLVPGQATPPVAGAPARRSLDYGFDLD